MNEEAKAVLATKEKAFAEEAAPAAGSGVKYAHNVLEGFGNGCLLDLRVRVALDLLKSPMFTHADELQGPGTAEQLARFALDIAGSLLEQAEARGWVEELPEDAGLNRQCRLQAERTARYQVLQQIAGSRIAADEAGSSISRVGPVVPGRTFNQ